MEIRPLREGDLPALVEALWLPFARGMGGLAPHNELDDDVDLVAAGTEFRRERLAEDDSRTWIALADGDPAGYASAELSESPPVFARGDGVNLDELFVRGPHRGTGLAADLLGRVEAWAADLGAERLTLSVDRVNDRAFAFYERHGFETYRYRMGRPVDG